MWALGAGSVALAVLYYEIAVVRKEPTLESSLQARINALQAQINALDEIISEITLLDSEEPSESLMSDRSKQILPKVDADLNAFYEPFKQTLPLWKQCDAKFDDVDWEDVEAVVNYMLPVSVSFEV